MHILIVTDAWHPQINGVVRVLDTLRSRLMDRGFEVINDLGGPSNLFIGGKSLGGRMATMIATELETEETPVRGVVVTGIAGKRWYRSGPPKLEDGNTIHLYRF